MAIVGNLWFKLDRLQCFYFLIAFVFVFLSSAYVAPAGAAEKKAPPTDPLLGVSSLLMYKDAKKIRLGQSKVKVRGILNEMLRLKEVNDSIERAVHFDPDLDPVLAMIFDTASRRLVAYSGNLTRKLTDEELAGLAKASVKVLSEPYNVGDGDYLFSLVMGWKLKTSGFCLNSSTVFFYQEPVDSAWVSRLNMPKLVVVDLNWVNARIASLARAIQPKRLEKGEVTFCKG
jgi:hypothetical protein